MLVSYAWLGQMPEPSQQLDAPTGATALRSIYKEQGLDVVLKVLGFGALVLGSILALVNAFAKNPDKSSPKFGVDDRDDGFFDL